MTRNHEWIQQYATLLVALLGQRVEYLARRIKDEILEFRIVEQQYVRDLRETFHCIDALKAGRNLNTKDRNVALGVLVELVQEISTPIAALTPNFDETAARLEPSRLAMLTIVHDIRRETWAAQRKDVVA